jgi:hypothetical protein
MNQRISRGDIGIRLQVLRLQHSRPETIALGSDVRKKSNCCLREQQLLDVLSAIQRGVVTNPNRLGLGWRCLLHRVRVETKLVDHPNRDWRRDED